MFHQEFCNTSCTPNYVNSERATSTPILAYPKFYYMFMLYMDASSVSLRAVLSQEDGHSIEGVVAYASRVLSDHTVEKSTSNSLWDRIFSFTPFMTSC